jgi:hypothetical protein
VKILGYDYELRWLDEDLNGESGTCRGCTQVIGISGRDHPQQRISTMLHEIIEAINYQLNLGLAHTQITAIETGMFSALTSNGVDLTPLLEELPDEQD